MILENEDIMAAAEARAAWQRAANRCFVQEDAKRAPKLACCSSSSPQQNDSNNADAANVHNQFASSLKPLTWTLMNSNLSSDTKWWLQKQPNLDYKKEFMSEQLKGLFNNELVEAEEETANQAVLTTDEESESKSDNLAESYCVVSAAASAKHDSKAQIEEAKEIIDVVSMKPPKHKLDIGACNFQQEVLNLKPIEYLPSLKKAEMANLDLETQWERSNKCEPWWRVSDEELALFVAQKSLENIENCDLPKPTHMCRNPFHYFESLEGNGACCLSLGCNLDGSVCLPIDCPDRSSMVRELSGDYLHSIQAQHCFLVSKKLGSEETRSPSTLTVDLSDGQRDSARDPSRIKLLEALCLSQTRARKAEIAAQKAYDEKEHIVKLLFKQASHLFAYKQWLQMLQLESIFLQLRIREHQISSVLPILPWMPLRGKPVAKGDGKRKAMKQKRCRLCKYAFLFAIGLGLAGAGLLLGCCFGLLSPLVE